MTIEPELLMAYADGELDPLTAKRVERAIAADPALAREVERHRRLRARLSDAFAPVTEEPVPDRLAALLPSNVIPLRRPRRTVAFARWRAAGALAASLVIGLMIGSQMAGGPVTARGDGLYASGALAGALDRRLGGEGGAVRIAASFRDGGGAYCRVFLSRPVDGVACRQNGAWALRRTNRSAEAAPAAPYAQAGSADPQLMAAAQEMMAGEPLDAAAERAARDAGWR
jgi:hypothetical protein